MKIAHELLSHDILYLGWATVSYHKAQMRYAQYSPGYMLGAKLTGPDIRPIYEQETMSIVQPRSFCGIWQLHALASVIRVPIMSLYPAIVPP